MQHDIFISHSSIDEELAHKVCFSLEQNGMNCWIAPRNVKSGFTYGAQIIEAIRKCSVFILIFSQNSNASDDVKTEVQNAFKRKKTIIPFRIDDADMDDELEYFLSAKHWIMLNSKDSTNFIDLVSAASQALQKKTRQVDGLHADVPLFATDISLTDPARMRKVPLGTPTDLENGLRIKLNSARISELTGQSFVLIANVSFANLLRHKTSVTQLLCMLTDSGEEIEHYNFLNSNDVFSFPFIAENGYVYTGMLSYIIPNGTKTFALFARNLINGNPAGPSVFFYSPQ